MRGVIEFPQAPQLAWAIDRLQTQKNLPSKELSQWSQWARLEPRIAEVLLAYIRSNWKNISPLELNSHIRVEPWPAALGVILGFCDLYLGDSTERKAFRNWADLVMLGIAPEDNAQFFYGLRKFAGALMLKDARFSLKPYRDWGYISQELLVKSSEHPHRNPYPQEVRQQVIEDLLKEKSCLSIQDYLHRLNHQISVRQAERDLLNFKNLHPVGRTRARMYCLKAKKTKNS